MRCTVVSSNLSAWQRWKKPIWNTPNGAELRRRLEVHLRWLEREIKSLAEQMDQLIDEDKILAGKRTRLVAISGVGPRTVRTLLACLPELGQLGRKQVSSLAGLARVIRESGQWRGRSSSGQGRESVREALYMAALSAAHHNAHLKDFCQRLRDAGKPPKVALCAVARKLLIALNSSLKAVYQAT